MKLLMITCFLSAFTISVSDTAANTGWLNTNLNFELKFLNIHAVVDFSDRVQVSTTTNDILVSRITGLENENECGNSSSMDDFPEDLFTGKIL